MTTKKSEPNPNEKAKKPKRAHKPTSGLRWRDDFVEYGGKLAAAGCTDREIAKALGVSRETVMLWKKKHPEFGIAIHEARNPSNDALDSALVKMQERQGWANEWIDEYLRTKGKTTVDQSGDGMGSFVKTEWGGEPSKWLIDRILGPAEHVQAAFEVKVTMAVPEKFDDDDDDLYDFDGDD
jgi:transposase